MAEDTSVVLRPDLTAHAHGDATVLKHPSSDLDQLCINTIRTLAMDAVQQANSGHPDTPMGLAPLAYVLWTRYLRRLEPVPAAEPTPAPAPAAAQDPEPAPLLTHPPPEGAPVGGRFMAHCYGFDFLPWVRCNG